MEEKERYTVERFEIDEPSCIFDNKTQQRILSLVEYNYYEIVNLEKLLNQYYKRIKELEEYIKSKENCNEWLTMADNDNLQKENQQLKQQLEESEKENKALKDIRTLERVIPKNTQLNKLSNRDCYLKGFDNAISETIRVFEESYGKDKTELIEERNEYLSDIVKVGGYRHQIKQLKRQLHDLPKKIVGEIKDYINNHSYLTQVNSKNRKVVYNISLVRFLDTILKKFGGENE